MKTLQETGHVKNITAFEQLIGICRGFGPAYNPANPSLAIPQLQTLFTAVTGMAAQVRERETASTNSTDIREDVVNGAKTYARQVVNALSVLGVSAAKLENAKDLLKKMDGKRLTDLPDPPPDADPNAKPVVIRSSAQTSYDNFMEHFAKLAELVKSEPGYKPNEPELTHAGINAKMDELQAVNKVAMDADISKADIYFQRFQLMYRDVVGMVDIANAVKRYVKSVFGPSSPQYRQLSKLVFRKPRKKK